VTVKITLSEACGKFFYSSANFCARWQTYFEDNPILGGRGKVSPMSSHAHTEKILKALADTSRLQILECIENGVSNPGEIARKLDRHRSTVEKHLRVLLKAGIVEKVPSLTEAGHLSIRYRIRGEATQILAKIREACRGF
jgi:DNA-binding transcriptional ArsR family regulator